jgi:FolB domain-containing protein
MPSERVISIRSLEVMARVGVPEEERSNPQRLLVDLRFAASEQPPDLGDDIARTVDYFAVSRRVIALSRERPRRLIETLADELADHLLREFPLLWVEVTVRKFILPDTEHVSVSVRRDTPLHSSFLAPRGAS